jgi:hypothetical protein
MDEFVVDEVAKRFYELLVCKTYVVSGTTYWIPLESPMPRLSALHGCNVQQSDQTALAGDRLAV